MGRRGTRASIRLEPVRDGAGDRGTGGTKTRAEARAILQSETWAGINAMEIQNQNQNQGEGQN